MTLTRHLANPRSPLARFMADQLPGDRMCDAYTRAVHILPATLRPEGPLDTVPWTLLGTAIDTRLRIQLGETHHHGTQQGIGALYLTSATPPATPGHARTFEPYRNAAAAGDLLLDLLATYAATAVPLEPAQDTAAARAAVLAARFETIHRVPAGAIRRAMAHFTELRLSPDPYRALDELLWEIPTAWSDDIRRQNAAAQHTLAHLRTQEVHSSPQLDGAPDVGDAEPDLIAGHTLIDIKATLTPRLRPSHARAWFHQLAGYLLLDYRDHWNIEQVGFYLSRQQTLLTWEVRDFLKLMGARTTLEGLRLRLHDTLNPRPMKEFS